MGDILLYGLATVGLAFLAFHTLNQLLKFNDFICSTRSRLSRLENTLFDRECAMIDEIFGKSPAKKRSKK